MLTSFSPDFEVFSKKKKKKQQKVFKAEWLVDYWFWSISFKFNNIDTRSPQLHN